MRAHLVFACSILLFSLSPPLFAKSLQEAMNEAATYFVKEAVRIENNQELHILKLSDYVSSVRGETGKQLETELYFAFEKLHPDFKLYIGEVAHQEREIYLDGTYEQSPGKMTLRLRIFKDKEILSQTQVTFEQDKTHKKALVAVLDIHAKELNSTQKTAYSDVFRTALDRTGAFLLASSADIERMNPDAIQKTTGCTRDRCASIIGEQLGVDRSVSTSLLKVGENEYILSSKILDIKDGAILITRTVKHHGDFSGLDQSLEKLARALTQTESKLKTVKSQDANSPTWVWHLSASSLALVGALQAKQTTTKHNELAASNLDLKTQYSHAASQEELTNLQTRYQTNQTSMKQLKTQLSAYNGILALGVLWESYLIFFGGEAGLSSPSKTAGQTHLQLVPSSNPQANLVFTYNW